MDLSGKMVIVVTTEDGQIRNLLIDKSDPRIADLVDMVSAELTELVDDSTPVHFTVKLEIPSIPDYVKPPSGLAAIFGDRAKVMTAGSSKRNRLERPLTSFNRFDLIDPDDFNDDMIDALLSVGPHLHDDDPNGYRIAVETLSAIINHRLHPVVADMMTDSQFRELATEMELTPSSLWYGYDDVLFITDDQLRLFAAISAWYDEYRKPAATTDDVATHNGQ